MRYTLNSTPVWWNGRRSGFKIRRWRHRVGSSPTTGTKPTKSEPDLPCGRRVRILRFLQESVFLQWCTPPSRIQAERPQKEEIKMIGGIGDEKADFLRVQYGYGLCGASVHWRNDNLNRLYRGRVWSYTHCEAKSILDYLIYNAPLEYAELVLSGDIETLLQLSWYCIFTWN